MAQQSNIEWTDGTWPIVQGCDYESPGCIHCYAVPLIWRLSHNPLAKISAPLQGLVEKRTDGTLVWTGKVALREDRLDWPRTWKKPLKIFVPSHGDLFHEDVPNWFVDRVFLEIEECAWHIFQLLTKRDERMREYVNRRYEGREPPKNLWLGVSAERQIEYDKRARSLMNTKAAVRFISAEPLLEHINLRFAVDAESDEVLPFPCPGMKAPTGKLHQVICGGESGPKKRPTSLAWHRSLRDQCAAAGIAFFEKQIDKKQPIPVDLMVREFPKVPA